MERAARRGRSARAWPGSRQRRARLLVFSRARCRKRRPRRRRVRRSETRCVGRCTQPRRWPDRLDRHGSAVHADGLAERALLAAERGARFIRSYPGPRLHRSRRPFPGGACSLPRDPRGRARRRVGRHRCSGGGHSGWVAPERAAGTARGSCRAACATRAGDSRRTGSLAAQERAAVAGSDACAIRKAGKSCCRCGARATSVFCSRCACRAARCACRAACCSR